MAIKTTEELEELLGVLALWAHARKTFDDAQAECADCFKVLREAERKLSEVVMNAADSTDEDGSEPDKDEPPRSREEAAERARAYADAMTDEEDARLHAAALADPDNPPLTDKDER